MKQRKISINFITVHVFNFCRICLELVKVSVKTCFLYHFSKKTVKELLYMVIQVSALFIVVNHLCTQNRVVVPEGCALFEIQ